METTSQKQIRIGVLTQPVSDKMEPDEFKPPDQYVLDPLKSFLEAAGALVVPLRYNLIDTPELLKKTLECLDGVLFTGGFLQIKAWKQMPTVTRTYYNCAKEVFQYCMETKLPLLAICQGF